MKTRVAVIGSGFGLYGLLPAFQRLPECSVVGIAGANTDRLVKYCRQTSVAAFTDWREMIEQQKPEALAVAVVPQYQPEIILYALERGISVLAEKPLALTLDQSVELLARARNANVAHAVDFLFPEIPAWKQAQELMGQGAIGNVIQMTASWSFLSHDLRNKLVTWKTDPTQGGGALSFFFSHVFYNLEFFLGKIRSLCCQLNAATDSPNHGETAVSMLVQFENGCSGNVMLNCAALNERRHRLEFFGEKGVIVLENFTSEISRGWELKCYDENGPMANQEIANLDSDSELDERVSLVQSIGHRFLGWCQGGDPARPNFEDGCRVQQLIELARISSQQGRVVAVS